MNDHTICEGAYKAQGDAAALDLMLRVLYATWASNQPDPLGWLAEAHAGMIQSLANIADLSNPHEHRILEHAEAKLDEMFENIGIRLSNYLRGSPSAS